MTITSILASLENEQTTPGYGTWPLLAVTPLQVVGAQVLLAANSTHRVEALVSMRANGAVSPSVNVYTVTAVVTTDAAGAFTVVGLQAPGYHDGSSGPADTQKTAAPYIQVDAGGRLVVYGFHPLPLKSRSVAWAVALRRTLTHTVAIGVVP